MPADHHSDEEDRSSAPELLASIVGNLRIVDRELNRHSVKTEEAVGISYTEVLFLRIVCAMPGARLSAVAHKMALSQGASSNIKRNLVNLGLIEERQDEDDKRGVRLHPTRNGYRLTERSRTEVHSPIRIATDNMSIKELLRLNEALLSLTRRINMINIGTLEEVNTEAPQRKTEPQVRRAFASYFLDLKASVEADGGHVNKSYEWERFIEKHIEDGDVVPDAKKWKCPKSLDAELRRPEG